MPRRRRTRTVDNVTIDLVDSDDECKNKRPRTRQKKAPRTARGSKSALPSCDDALTSNKRSNRIATSNRDKKNKDKLDTDIFESYLEDLWKHVDEEKRSAYAYFDSLWFNMYNSGHNKPNVLKWIKAKNVFSRQYVFVPIVCWGHWNLLVLCNFGKTDYLGTDKGPRMLLLDSLKTTNPTRLRSAIRRFIADIFKTEEREESEQYINKICLEFPEVPQQNGDECGIYVLYFIYCFLQNKILGEDFSQLFDEPELENFRKGVHSFQENRKKETEE
ncbi:probable ubiquitin-like-specific protease 2B [Oryza brachyantha]|uniref:Ubiquitin-like protease family profile domain-containing protein n=1 Tax=Oryza brachyantha TaxID=4533 RepID=J3N6U4_ORYBR|nr:probable ubiquitin-like-specific protease 2B [Oryza brachyantha]